MKREQKKNCKREQSTHTPHDRKFNEFCASIGLGMKSCTHYKSAEIK